MGSKHGATILPGELVLSHQTTERFDRLDHPVNVLGPLQNFERDLLSGLKTKDVLVVKRTMAQASLCGIKLHLEESGKVFLGGLPSEVQSFWGGVCRCGQHNQPASVGPRLSVNSSAVANPSRQAWAQL